MVVELSPAQANPTGLNAPGAPVTMLYIGGVGRSGSTLLNDLLGQHRDVVAVGELVHLFQRGLIENNLCGCGERFSDCPFWSGVGEELGSVWDRGRGVAYEVSRLSVDRNRYTFHLLSPINTPRFARSLREYGHSYEELVVAIRDRAGRRVVVDSSKQISTALLLRRLRGIDLRIVHLVRDSRGVAFSWSKQKRKVEVVDTDELMNRYRPGLMAWRWLSWNVIFAGLRLLRLPVMTVRYEDLIAEPTRTVTAVLEFAGVTAGPITFIDGDEVDLAAVHSVAGNPSRFENGRVKLRLDEAWRGEMPARARRLVTLGTLPLLARYGYLRGGRRR